MTRFFFFFNYFCTLVYITFVCLPGGVHLPCIYKHRWWSQRFGFQAAEAQPYAQIVYPGSSCPPLGGGVFHQKAHNRDHWTAQPMILSELLHIWGPSEHWLMCSKGTSVQIIYFSCIDVLTTQWHFLLLPTNILTHQVNHLHILFFFFTSYMFFRDLQWFVNISLSCLINVSEIAITWNKMFWFIEYFTFKCKCSLLNSKEL